MKKYLEKIYELTNKGDNKTSTSKVAEELEVADSSVTEAVQKLEEQNLICRAPYQGFTLSPMGKEKAEKITKNQKILKNFFKNTLNTNIEDIETQEIEENLTQEAINKIEKLNS